MARPQLSLVDDDGMPDYPVSSDLRLNGHYFTRIVHDRYLNSDFRLTASIAVRGAAFELMLLSQKQLPVGTLPEAEVLLAEHLHLPLRSWQALMSEDVTPLDGWHPCKTDRGIRLMHPEVLEMIQDTVEKRTNATEAREAENQRQRLKRLSERVVHAGGTERMASSPDLLERLDAWLMVNCSSRYRTVAWVRKGLEELSLG